MTIPAIYKFVNWITGTPVPIDDAMASALTPTIDSSLLAALRAYQLSETDVYIARDYNILPTNSAADNTTNFNALIAIVNAGGGGIIWLPRGVINLNALNTITANSVHLIGQGSFSGGTELRFNNTSGDCITLSTSGHQRIEGVYITCNVIRTSGYAIKLANGCFRPTIRDVRIDYHYSGIYVSNATETLIEDITLRYLIGNRGIQLGGTAGDNLFGIRINNIAADCPYPVSAPTPSVVKTWAITTAFNAGDVISNNGNIYQCSTGGTSAGAGTGPSGVPGTGGSSMFSTTIQDGTAVWKFVANGGINWITQDSFAYSLSLSVAALLNGFQGFVHRDGVNSGTSYPKWAEIFDLECDHSYGATIALNAGSGFYLSMGWLGSSLTSNGLLINGGHKGSIQVVGSRILGNAQHGIVLSAGPVDTIITNSELALNSQLTANTYHGIVVGVAATDFTISNCSSGLSPEGSGQQNTGILISAGASDHYNVVNNRVRGNLTAGFTDGGAGANKTTTGNIL